MRLPPCSSLARKAVPHPLHLTSMATATPFRDGQSLQALCEINGRVPKPSEELGANGHGRGVAGPSNGRPYGSPGESRKQTIRDLQTRNCRRAGDRLALGRNPEMRRRRSVAFRRPSSWISSRRNPLHRPSPAILKIGTVFATNCFHIRSLGSGPGGRAACPTHLRLPLNRILPFQLEILPCLRSAVIRAVCC